MFSEDPLTPTEIRELDAFLAAHRDQNGMDLVEVDGLLCAVACAPSMLQPSAWLPEIFGEDAPRFKSANQAQKILGLLMRLYNDTVGATRDGTYAPKLPPLQRPGTDNRAEPWARAFMRGMALDTGWERLSKDATSHMLIVPIFILAGTPGIIEDPTPDPAASEGLIGMLPQIVQLVLQYWSEGSPGSVRGGKPKRRAASAAKRAASSTAAPQQATIHRLKITLLDIKPPIWRRVEIPSDTMLPQVSRILLMAMGWTDTHLHAFNAGGITYADPDPDFPDDFRNERQVTLAQLVRHPKDQFVFDYDFGDGWKHRVDVEAIIEPASGVTYPRCVTGKRACPPEDCGGPWGYADLLAKLADPHHEDHAAMVEWIGGPIDPNAFDVEDTNAGIATLAPKKRRAPKAPLASRAGQRTNAAERRARAAEGDNAAREHTSSDAAPFLQTIRPLSERSSKGSARDGLETRLSSEERDRLEAIMERKDPDGPMGASIARLHGFFTSVLSGPPIMPSAWIPMVFGDSDERAWNDIGEAQRAMDLLMRFYNEIAGDLQGDPGAYSVLLDSLGDAPDNVVLGDDWCRGYLLGTAFDQAAWKRAMNDPAISDFFQPILAVASRSEPELMHIE